MASRAGEGVILENWELMRAWFWDYGSGITVYQPPPPLRPLRPPLLAAERASGGRQRRKMSFSRLAKQRGGSRKCNNVDAMEDTSSSDEDAAPESMSSNTKTAEAGAAARAAKVRQRPIDSSSDESRDGGNDDDDDGGDDDVDNDGFGKRKADDFLRRQELVMDAGFKATVVLPGDDVTESTTRTTRTLRLGPGLVQHTPEKVLATRAGVLRYRPPCSYWVESNGRRYGAKVEDQVLGVVEDRMMESYKVSIFGR